MVYNNYDSNFSFYQSQNGYLGMSLPTHAIMENSSLRVLDSHSRLLSYYSQFNNTSYFAAYGKNRSPDGMVSNAQSVVVDQINDLIYISDSFNHRVQVFDGTGKYITKYGGIGGAYGYGTLLNYFHYPKQMDVDDNGTLYVADYANSRVVSKEVGSSYFTTEVSSTGVTFPWGVAAEGNKVYVTDWKDDKVKVFERGVLNYAWGGTGSNINQLNKPADIKIGQYKGEGSIFVVDCGNHRVQIFDMNGLYKGSIGQPLDDPLENYEGELNRGSLLLPYGIAFDEEDNIIISDTSHKCIRVYDQSGVLINTWGEMSNANGNFFSPMGLDYNPVNRKLMVTDGVLQRVQIFNKVQ